MMGNVDLAPEVDVIALEPLLSPNVVSELLDTYMSTLTVSRKQCAGPTQAVRRAGPCAGSRSQTGTGGSGRSGQNPTLTLAVSGSLGSPVT